MIPLFLLTALAHASCDFDNAKGIIARDKTGYTAEWTLDDTPALSAPLVTTDANYRNLKSWIAEHTTETWKQLLGRNRSAFQEALRGMKPGDGGYAEFERSVRADDLILSGAAGTVHAIACLESIPYLEYLKVVDLRRYPQEFSAVVLKLSGKVKILGDFYFTPGADGPTGAEESPASLAVKNRLIAEGWQFYAHIHDHTFSFEDMAGDLGGDLAPSGPDIALYLSEKPVRAIISDGLDTIELTQEDVLRLSK
jgi:hypothetical protein